MGRVLRREAVKRDLIAQWVWYAEAESVELADRFLRAVEFTFETLSRQPDSGVRRSFQDPRLHGIRRCPVSGPYDSVLIFYYPLADGIDVVRIVHARRDLEQLARERFFG